MTDNAMVSTGQSFAHQLLSNGLNVNALRSNALLRKEEWVAYDQTVVDVARGRLNGVADLQAKGLVLQLGGLGTLVSQYEAQSDMTEADISMAGVTPGEEGSVEFDLRSVPIPIIHKDFRVNIRRLLASRKLGDSIDTTQAAVAARRVADMNENILFNGAGISVDGNSIYGYTNHPKRTTGTLKTWDATTNQANIYNDVLDMIEDAQDVHYYGPYTLYIASDKWMPMLSVYTDGTGDKPLDRVLALPQIEAVKVSDVLAEGSAVLVQLTADVVDLAVGQDITTVQWDSMGGMQAHFKVMNAMAPRIKYDYNDQCGIVHYTKATATGGGT